MPITAMKTVFEYAKLNKEEKHELLIKEAFFLEHYYDNGNTIYVYYLNGYFIELTTKNGVILYNLPFKRGYKLSPRMELINKKRLAMDNFVIQEIAA